MKITDLIGEFVDIFGEPTQAEQPEIAGTATVIQNRPDVQEIEPETADNTDQTKMIAPLQQKLELLKRAVGVENFYDQEESDVDELEKILKIAGVPTASIFDAGDDEPLDS